MVIEEEITIQAPLNIVWKVFSGFENWDDWTSTCQMCHYQEGSEMVSGACVSFVVKPFVFPVRVAPRITHCDPGREVIWEGGRLGIHAVCIPDDSGKKRARPCSSAPSGSAATSSGWAS